MRKLLMTMGLALCVATVSAQDNDFDDDYQALGDDRSVGTTTKKGQKILPQAGDYALGIDASPLFEYAGNAFNTGHNSAPYFSYSDDLFKSPAIFGKYFLSDQTAIRAKLHIGVSSESKTVMVNSTTDATKKVSEKTTTSANGFGLSAGYEIRRGYGRLQGYFGPEIGLGITSKSVTKDFEEGLSNTNVGPRTIENSDPSSFQMKAGGFLGVEYFVAPKISVGGEVGLGLRFISNGKSKLVTERWNGSTKETTTTEGGNSSNFNIATAYSSALNVTFHF